MIQLLIAFAAAIAPSTSRCDDSEAEVRGTIVRDDGAPAAGVEVALLDWRHDERWWHSRFSVMNAEEGPAPLEAHRTQTDADGQFVLSGVSHEGRYELGADLGGPRATSWLLHGLCAGGPTELGRLSLRSTRRVRGRVVTSDGQPIAGATVHGFESDPEILGSHCLLASPRGTIPIAGIFKQDELMGLEMPRWLAGYRERFPAPRCVTETDGRFELFLDASPQASIQIAANGITTTRKALEPEQDDLGDVGVDRLRRLPARFVDGEGRPVAGVEVAASPSRDRSRNRPGIWGLRPCGRTDAEGRIEVSVPPGNPRVGLLLGYRQDGRDDWRLIQDLKPEDLLEITVEEPGEIVIHVFDASGRPLTDAEATLAAGKLSFGWAWTGDFFPAMPVEVVPTRTVPVDAQGTARFPSCRMGAYKLLIRAPGHTRHFVDLDLESARTERSFVLRPASAHRVRLIDADTQQFLPQRQLPYRDAQGREVILVADEGGFVRMDPAGRDVMDPLGQRTAEWCTSEWQFSVPGEGHLEFRVVDEKGAPLEAIVRIGEQHFRTDALGMFRRPEHPAGVYAVAVMPLPLVERTGVVTGADWRSPRTWPDESVSWGSVLRGPFKLDTRTGEELGWVEVSSAGMSRAEFTLGRAGPEPRGVVAGRVTFCGEPPPITLTAHVRGEESEEQGMLRADGRFEVPARVGPSLLTIRSEHGQSLSTCFTRCNADGSDPCTIDLPLRMQEIRVVDASGRPVSEAAVLALADFEPGREPSPSTHIHLAITDARGVAQALVRVDQDTQVCCQYGTVVVAPESREDAITLRLPEARTYRVRYALDRRLELGKSATLGKKAGFVVFRPPNGLFEIATRRTAPESDVIDFVGPPGIYHAYVTLDGDLAFGPVEFAVEDPDTTVEVNIPADRESSKR